MFKDWRQLQALNNHLSRGAKKGPILTVHWMYLYLVQKETGLLVDDLHNHCTDLMNTIQKFSKQQSSSTCSCLHSAALKLWSMRKSLPLPLTKTATTESTSWVLKNLQWRFVARGQVGPLVLVKELHRHMTLQSIECAMLMCSSVSANFTQSLMMELEHT